MDFKHFNYIAFFVCPLKVHMFKILISKRENWNGLNVILESVFFKCKLSDRSPFLKTKVVEFEMDDKIRGLFDLL